MVSVTSRGEQKVYTLPGKLASPFAGIVIPEINRQSLVASYIPHAGKDLHFCVNVTDTPLVSLTFVEK